MLKTVSDEDLVKMVREGNMSAFKSLVEKYEKPISNVVIGMLGNSPEAEEVGQDVFLKFFYTINHFRLDSSLKTYLTRIAINLSLNELKRRKKNRERYVYDEELRYRPGLVEQNNYEFEELVAKALQALHPQLRSVVVLRLIEGYSTRETSDLLRIPVGTVLSRLARAQEKLRLIIKDL